MFIWITNSRAKHQSRHDLLRRARVTFLVVSAVVALLAPAIVNPLQAYTANHEAGASVAESDPSPGAQPSQDQADEVLLNAVWGRLLGVAKRPANLVWPPQLHVLTANDLAELKMDPNDPNAFALLLQGKPLVCVTPSLLSTIVEGNPDRLAFILGHELSHITLGHVRRKPAGDTRLVFTVYSSAQELEADKQGMEFALAAGYDFRQALSAARVFIDLGKDHPPLWPADHPSWTKRLTDLDKQRATLWQAMGAFSNGLFFLAVEQYASAERCFTAVVQQFPDSYEAQADLGYARLMQYCDLLTPDDVRDFKIGHLMIGAFYNRPDSLLEKSKGKDTVLWESAKEALQKALSVNPDLTLAKANLGVAYLVRPQGSDTEKAIQYLSDAAQTAVRDRLVGGVRRAVILINLGVAELAAGQAATSDQRFRDAYRLAGNIPIVRATIMYNHAKALLDGGSAAQKGEALTVLSDFLQMSSPASIWWKLGVEQYAKLCSEQHKTCPTETELLKNSGALTRRVVGVDLKDGKHVQIGDAVAEIEKQLGTAQRIPLVRAGKLARLRYGKYGVELICTDQVMAISLQGPSAPAVTVQESGAGGGKRTLRLGMGPQQVAQVLGATPYVAPAFDARVPYRFYPNCGIAARYVGGRAVEYLIVVVPWKELSA